LVELRKEVKDVSTSTTDDSTTKQRKIQALQLEIETLEMEIQQKQAKAAQKATNKQATAQFGTNTNNPTATDSRLIDQLA
jgi:predicted RNase H-like nuclease (RuvC/YqgF family)